MNTAKQIDRRSSSLKVVHKKDGGLSRRNMMLTVAIVLGGALAGKSLLNGREDVESGKAQQPDGHLEGGTNPLLTDLENLNPESDFFIGEFREVLHNHEDIARPRLEAASRTPRAENRDFYAHSLLDPWYYGKKCQKLLGDQLGCNGFTRVNRFSPIRCTLPRGVNGGAMRAYPVFCGAKLQGMVYIDTENGAVEFAGTDCINNIASGSSNGCQIVFGKPRAIGQDCCQALLSNKKSFQNGVEQAKKVWKRLTKAIKKGEIF